MKLVVNAFVTLDGVMQAPGGPDEDPDGGFRYGGWTAPYFDEDMGRTVQGSMERPPPTCSGGRRTTSSRPTGRV